MKVCRVEEMRRMDKQATAEYGIPPELLMENAGEAVYAIVQQKLGIQAKSLLFCAGPATTAATVSSSPGNSIPAAVMSQSFCW